VSKSENGYLSTRFANLESALYGAKWVLCTRFALTPGGLRLPAGASLAFDKTRLELFDGTALAAYGRPKAYSTASQGVDVPGVE